MRNASLRRKTVLLLLVAVLAAPWAWAAGPSSAGPAAPVSLDLLQRFLGFLESLWNETGCYIDPDGRCATGTAGDATPATTQGDEGCYIDPSGRCVP